MKIIPLDEYTRSWSDYHQHSMLLNSSNRKFLCSVDPLHPIRWHVKYIAKQGITWVFITPAFPVIVTCTWFFQQICTSVLLSLIFSPIQNTLSFQPLLSVFFFALSRFLIRLKIIIKSFLHRENEKSMTIASVRLLKNRKLFCLNFEGEKSEKRKKKRKKRTEKEKHFHQHHERKCEWFSNLRFFFPSLGSLFLRLKELKVVLLMDWRDGSLMARTFEMKYLSLMLRGNEEAFLDIII